MPAWEYRVFKFSTSGVIFRGGKIPEEWLTTELNKLGQRGWELVSTFTSAIGSGATNEVAAILKRPSAADVLPDSSPEDAELEALQSRHFYGSFNCKGCGAERDYKDSKEIDGVRYCASCAAKRA